MSVVAVHTPDDALQALREHADELSHWQNSDLNESDTRSKIIDTLLLQVLGWDEASIRREVRTANGGYSDYVVQNERTAFVLEAKRAGHYFEMPILASREAARNGVLAQSRELKAALDQVVTYCRAQGHPVGAVSNGLQLALTLPFHDGSRTHDTIFSTASETSSGTSLNSGTCSALRASAWTRCEGGFVPPLHKGRSGRSQGPTRSACHACRRPN